MSVDFPRPTKTYRASPYPAILATRPELSVKGQTVLITGGATGIGWETTKAFAQAGAETIVLVARAQQRMTDAKKSIESSFPNTKVVTYSASITDFAEIDRVVKEIGTIDILVLNAGFLNDPVPILELNSEILAQSFDVNVFGPLNMIKAFVKLPPRSSDARRTIISTSAMAINFVFPGAGAYSASKMAMSYIMRCIGEENPDANIRTFAFHPAVTYTDMAVTLGFSEDAIPFDTVDLPAHFAVWLCSPEADYLSGRWLSANWDVEELKEKKDAIEKDPSLLNVMTHLGTLVEG